MGTSEQAMYKHIARVELLGGKDLGDPWEGVLKPRRAVCKRGHECNPKPAEINNGRGFCKPCGYIDHSERAFQRHIDRVEKLGGQDLNDPWGGMAKPRRVMCPQGHESSVSPSYIQQGGGICPICAGQDPYTLLQKHIQRVKDLGGEDAGDPWKGSKHSRRIVCSHGHVISRSPESIKRTQELCLICVKIRKDNQALCEHISRIEALGGKDAGGMWEGMTNRRQAVCAQGHECAPLPTYIKMGGGMCNICTNSPSSDAFQKHIERVELLGGTDLDGPWKGMMKRRKTLCSQGHECMVLPNSIHMGQGLCRRCKGLIWDAFYVVRNPSESCIKFGVTSRGGKSRIRTHKGDGFTEVVRLWTNLPGTVAPDMEKLVKLSLRDAGEHPLRGVEYFPDHALGLILDLADNYPKT